MPGTYSLPIDKPRFLLVELFGGDNNLSSFVDIDLNEIADGLPHDAVMLGLTDHFGDTAKVVCIARGKAQVLDSLGEIDTGDPEVLIAFLSRSLASVPATTPVALGFWDHGSGVFDELDPKGGILARGRASTPRSRSLPLPPRRRLFWGERPANANLRAMLHDDTNGGLLTTLEAGRVLRESLANAGRSKVEMIFSDTCLNGMVEVLAEFDAFGSVVVGSEELEPGDGWDYHRWLGALGQGAVDGDRFGRTAVDAYQAAYQNRAGKFTLGAFRRADDLVAGFRHLVAAAQPLGENGFMILDAARRHCQSFDRRDSYDIADFAIKLRHYASDAALQAAADGLFAAAGATRVASCALGSEVAAAQGLAFWFPSSRAEWLKTSATYADLRFDRETGWARYLGQYF